MKLLLDQGLPRSVAALLCGAGIDILAGQNEEIEFEITPDGEVL